MVARQLDHMNKLIAGLLDAATIEGGRMTLERGRHVAADVATDAIELVRTLAEERGVKIVPPANSRGEAVSCDRERVLQVVTNLLGNAIRFSPPDGFVVMTIEPDGDDYVRFTVADEGPGIPPSERERVFERFVHGTTKPGLGLGLYIAKGIVAGHGGRIWVDPTPSGTRVAFTLPRA
jgi:signal transduction histidine kinase